jgi:hypothetical protein
MTNLIPDIFKIKNPDSFNLPDIFAHDKFLQLTILKLTNFTLTNLIPDKT